MTERKPIGLTVPCREVGYKEKKEWEIKRPWVGLTPVDRASIWAMPQEKWIDATEQRLKEKNA